MNENEIMKKMKMAFKNKPAKSEIKLIKRKKKYTPFSS
jgi:hypothetical protein